MDGNKLYSKYFNDILNILGDHASMGIVLIENGKLHIKNKVVDILEYSKDEIAQWTINDFYKIIHPKSHNLLFKEIHKYQNKEISIANVELQIVTKNRLIKWVRFFFKQIIEENNQIDIIILIDNTEQRKNEIELKKRENQLNAILQNAPDVISRFDRELRHVYISPAIEKITGNPPSYYLGKRHKEIDIPQFTGNVIDRFIKKCFENGVIETLIIEYPSDNGYLYLQLKVAPEYNEEGLIESVLCITRDVTKEVKIENEVKMLKGLIPICASCHKIRDDKGYWTMLEKYLQQHTGSEFTHGLCPDCIKKLYPEIDIKDIELDEKR
jgi:PAS domain S-box-containing protein